MKKISKVLMVALFSMVGLSSGQAKGEEGDSKCRQLSGWCEEHWNEDLSPYCDPPLDCLDAANEVVACMYELAICWPYEDFCGAASKEFQSCMNEYSICGDEFVSGDEQCDDGNLIDGDGCSAACQVE